MRFTYLHPFTHSSIHTFIYIYIYAHTHTYTITYIYTCAEILRKITEEHRVRNNLKEEESRREREVSDRG